ncbi:MAG: efflux RND transporter periplasmic adaptor subunit [Planctomycetes bacterium]|nr:efflux RND transporter periplasmic adaptor subunit [Planctomycetota bacterium]
MMFFKQIVWLLVGAVIVLAGAFGYSIISGMQSSAHKSNDTGSAQPTNRMVVKTIYPKLDSAFVRSVTPAAFVEAYFKADLFAHVAGPVKYIEKNIGDPVKIGELLVEIDVPDLVQEIAQKDALVRQAEADRDAAQSHVQTLIEALETAKLFVPVKEAFLEQMALTRELKLLVWNRYKGLLEKKAVLLDVVEECEKDYKVSVATYKTADLGVATARSEFHAAEAKLAEARSDLKVKESRIQVAKRDKEKVQAQADWAKILAPFGGVITRRNVDPGAFVQNATTAKTEPMLTIMRDDIVTIYTLVPERSAAFIRDGQEAVIKIETEPGKKFKNLVGTVTRHSRALDTERGRTMRVEVDLYNPPLRGYKRSVREGVCSFLSSLGASNALGTIALWETGQQLWARPGLLHDGMYGDMSIILERFRDPYLIPSAAVFTHKGKTCILLVRDNVIQRVPVQVQLEDGIRAKVGIILREALPDSNDDDVVRELTPDDEIVLSGQGELADGQEVRTVAHEW